RELLSMKQRTPSLDTARYTDAWCAADPTTLKGGFLQRQHPAAGLRHRSAPSASAEGRSGPARAGWPFSPSFHPFGVEAAFLIQAFEGVRPEIVALRLNQVGRKRLRPITVVVGDGRGEAGHRHTHAHRLAHDLAQGRLVLLG